jgi:hypothetical protein
MPDGFMNRTAGNWRLMFAIADSLGDDARVRARDAARRILGVTDMPSAGVALLVEIKEIFDRSTLDYVTSKALVADLTADPEKQWAEWSRGGKPITEKGVAGLLHEFRIVSKGVGPDAAAKGYRKRDFADAWERYLPRATERESEPDPPILPSTRQTHWNDGGNGEKFAVNRGAARRQKNGGFANEINELDGLTGKTPDPSALSLSSVPGDSFDAGPFPDFLRVENRKVPLDRLCPLGPGGDGDSLDDLV